MVRGAKAVPPVSSRVRRTGGRLIAIVWMFAGIIIISSFTAAITSSLTLGQLQGPV